jgi:Tol biopolymer transport system component/tRNA A-37 threonylcarbamoyl transferase component Bud32
MHDIAQLNATLAGRYVIERQVGAGGMAVVYLARDLKHHRHVAVKVVNPDLSAVIGSERFLTEIQVTASLHHPHLVPLFDSGEADGALFYVMPYIEGETLRQRLARERQLGVAEAVRLATAIGGALDYAHRHGVIHRDLKPENILIHEGQPLVTDFGIALAVSNAGGPRITQAGLSLGTPHYMSPEQASGSGHVDARSDLYSLGAMLYEMLVGDPPHTGSTIQAIIARVLIDKPASVRASRDSVPEHVDAAVARALAKLPADRFATSAEFTAALADPDAVHYAPAAPSPMPSASPRMTPRRLALWGGGVVAAGALGALATLALRPPPAPHAAQFAVALPDTTTIPPAGRAVAVSRDGAWLVMSAALRTGTVTLYARPSTEMQFRALPGTEGAEAPSFSPDGSHVMFAAGGRLRKVPTRGGAVLTIADSGSAQASWGDGNQVVFARAGTLAIVPAAGGTPRLLARPDSAAGQLALGWPDVLPGGDHVLATLWKGRMSNDSAFLVVVAVADGAVRELGVRGTSPRYAAGHVVFADAAGKLWSARYQPGDATLRGTPVLLAEQVSVDSTGAADVAASDGGLLLYSEVATAEVRRISTGDGGARRRSTSIAVTDSTGVVRSMSSQHEPFYMPRVSPDGTQIAVASGAVMNSDSEIWVYDIASGALSRLTQNARVTRPEWDASGRRIAYRPLSWLTGSFLSQPADRSGTPVPIEGTESTLAFSWGSAGRYLAVERRVAPANHDLWLVPRARPSDALPIDTTAAHEILPRLSPNERWVAYLSNEGGRQQVYVRPVPGPGARVPISISGGESPTWSRDGKSLYYIEGGRLMAARLVDSPSFSVARRDTLIDLTTTGAQWLASDGGATLNYDVFPDGGFVFLATGGSSTSNRQNVIAMVDWTRRARANGR